MNGPITEIKPKETGTFGNVTDGGFFMAGWEPYLKLNPATGPKNKDMPTEIENCGYAYGFHEKRVLTLRDDLAVTAMAESIGFRSTGRITAIRELKQGTFFETVDEKNIKCPLANGRYYIKLDGKCLYDWREKRIRRINSDHYMVHPMDVEITLE